MVISHVHIIFCPLLEAVDELVTTSCNTGHLQAATFKLLA